MIIIIVIIIMLSCYREDETEVHEQSHQKNNLIQFRELQNMHPSCG